MDKRQVFCNEKGTLYLIATPIGNLSDISSRTRETLEMVDYLLCEDTRNTIKLLEHLNIKKQMFSYHKFNEKEMVSKVLKDLEEGKNIGLVSDAGYPGISDPGYIVSREAITASCNVSCIGGPSAFIHALVCSGIDSSHFMFYGFLDSKQVARTKELESLANVKETLIFYETSNRMNESLLDMKKVFGSRKFCVARELTKKYEEYIRGSLEEIVENVKELKGEIVLIVEGCKEKIEVINLNKLTVKEHFNHYKEKGLSDNDAMKSVAKDRNVSKNVIYKEIKC